MDPNDRSVYDDPTVTTRGRMVKAPKQYEAEACTRLSRLMRDENRAKEHADRLEQTWDEREK